MTLTTLLDLIESLNGRGGREAIVVFQRESIDRIRYDDLARRISHMASGLLGLGVTKGDRIAVLAPNQANWLVAVLASIRAGATVVPIDVGLSEENVAHILRDARPRVLCTVLAHADRVRSSGAASHTIILLDDAEHQQSFRGPHVAAAKDNSMPPLDAGDDALLFYTSGTTGPPKGVPLTHSNLVHQLNVLMEIRLLQPRDRLFVPLPLHHVYPFVMGMLLPLALGLPIIFPGGMTGPQMTKALRKGRGTVIVGVPRLYGAILEGVQREATAGGRVPAALLRTALGLSTLTRQVLGIRVGKHLLRSVGRRVGPRVRMAASGGAALSPELAYELESLGWDVVTGYGLSETSPLLTLNYPGRSRFTSAGMPIHGVDLRIGPTAQANENTIGQPRSTGRHVEGEVFARGPNVFAGYRNLPDKTREAFTADGWFRTGDLGFFDRRGFLHLTGRASTMIVTEGGKHVQPEDVEKVYQSHPAIREVGILQKDRRLVAIVVPARAASKTNHKENSAAVRKALDEKGRRLRPFERVVDFVITNEPLAKTRLGKLQRHELVERFERAKSGKSGSGKAGPLPEKDMSAEDQDLLRDPAVAAIWKWLTDRSPHVRLTLDSSLRMDLDVDSMEWLNLTLEIGRRARVELNEEAIGRVESVRDLLLEVSTAAKGGGAQLDDVLRKPRTFLDAHQRKWLKPLSPVQAALAQTLYFMNRMLMRACFHVHAVGGEHLPVRGGFVIAPNHASYLDPFAIAASLNYARLRRTCWAGWTGAAFRGPLTRGVSRLGRAVPIDPDRAVLSSLALVAAVLKRGDSLVWFPEGARSADGKLQELRPGIGILLEHREAVVVPTHIEGSYEALPRGAILPRPYRIRIIFGEAVTSQTLSHEGKGKEAGERITNALEKRLLALAREAHAHTVSRKPQQA